jgi:hypothetical protein
LLKPRLGSQIADLVVFKKHTVKIKSVLLLPSSLSFRRPPYDSVSLLIQPFFGLPQRERVDQFAHGASHLQPARRTQRRAFEKGDLEHAPMGDHEDDGFWSFLHFRHLLY